MASFIASQRGGEKLLYAGYIYSKHRTKDDKISWRCERFPKPNFCRGRAESVKGNVIETQEHNHQPCPQKCEAAKIASRIKETASTSTETVRAVVTACLTGASDEAIANMPKIASLQRCVKRVRDRRPAPEMEDLDLDLLEHFITEEQAPTFSRRIFRDRTNPLEVSNDIVFRSLFRFRRHVFTALLDELCEDFEHTAPQNCALLPAQQLGAALTVLGGNTFQSHAAAGLQVSQPTVSRCLERVVDAIIKKMNLFVKWPSENEARHISQRFFQTTGIPNIIGAIDGTHCRIQAPVDREYEYVNRKQFHSINCMVIAIPNLIAIGFSAKYPGRSHDSRIFKDSVIYEDFVHRRKKGVLLGDSAYGAERFLLKPILRPASDAERRYTEAIAYPVEVKFKSRSCVADLTETFKCYRTISSIEISAFFYSTVLPEAPFPEPSFSRKGILWLFPSLRSITALSLPGIGDLHRPSSPDQ
ncbi:hypothetical protein QR680_012601 [Steinernema hermaphroditum]|uniref:Putative nuclease HARBI1 n=1 Tax=Steinernema hermaphroditum TaxID=289476 RepID=A0AA39I5B0_9BILA|nr:hypothetical protein QR680_012601 [Steinernema hermaphroditum]